MDRNEGSSENLAEANGEDGLAMAGPFQLRDLLGTGGFGEVWYGVREEPFFQEVAVKIPRQDRRDQDALQRFEAERQAMALLNHPNVIRFFEGGVLKNGDPFYAMEFVDGHSITDFCDAQEMSIDERVALFIEACEGVAFVHEHGILHRDIKPANLIVDEASGNATVKLIDFGIARCNEFDEIGLVVGQTLDGALLGTRDYSSPEQIDGRHSELDETSDVFSLGAVLCELLCSVKPLDDKTLSESSISQIVNRLTEGGAIQPCERFSDLEASEREAAAAKRGGDVTWLTKILKGDLGKIVERAIEANPESRYATATELASDLQRFQAGEPVEAAELSADGAGRRSLKQKLFMMTAAFVATAGVVWGVQFLNQSSVESQDKIESDHITNVEASEPPSQSGSIQSEVEKCRERMASAQTHWAQDSTALAISDLRAIKNDVDAGSLDPPQGRNVAMRRKIDAQVTRMLIYCLLETGQVDEADALLRQVVPRSRKKIASYSKTDSKLSIFWKSTLASFITLKGDAERLRGNSQLAARYYVEAVRIIDSLGTPSEESSGGVRGWACHVGMPHGRLADVMVRPNSLVVSTHFSRAWAKIPGEDRSPMELYEAEREILKELSETQEILGKKQIALSFLKETRSWTDLEDLDKAKFCVKSAWDILKNQGELETVTWGGVSHLLGGISGHDSLPNFTLNRLQAQLLETERWMLQGMSSLENNDVEQAHEHFVAAQTVAERLAKNCPQAPECLHYSAQVKLRIADEFAAIPNQESGITQLRTLAIEALSSLKELDSENSMWGETLKYASAD